MIIVISPLVSLMEDQTNLLRKFGIPADSIGEDKALDLKIEKGECSVIFSSPESLLGNGRWRRFPGKTGPLYEKYLSKYSVLKIVLFFTNSLCTHTYSQIHR